MKIFVTSNRALLAGLLLFGGFNFCAAMFEKGDHCKIVRGDLIEIEQRLFEIFKEIRLIQHSCQYADWQDRVPLKYRGLSLSELQDKQRSLFPEMRKLKASLSDQQVESLSNYADQAANLEIGGPDSCDMASSIGSISSNRPLSKPV